jgi:hypothetical protein
MELPSMQRSVPFLVSPLSNFKHAQKYLTDQPAHSSPQMHPVASVAYTQPSEAWQARLACNSHWSVFATLFGESRQPDALNLHL